MNSQGAPSDLGLCESLPDLHPNPRPGAPAPWPAREATRPSRSPLSRSISAVHPPLLGSKHFSLSKTARISDLSWERTGRGIGDRIWDRGLVFGWSKPLDLGFRGGREDLTQSISEKTRVWEKRKVETRRNGEEMGKKRRPQRGRRRVRFWERGRDFSSLGLLSGWRSLD